MKPVGLKKKGVWFWILLAVWAAVLIAVVVLTATKAVNGVPRRIPVYAVETAEKRAALTFNAAWGDETTDGVLELLREHDVRATFFFVGSFAEKYPESVVKIANAGHELGNHSNRHRDPTGQSYAEIAADIAACSETLFSLTGRAPALYRAPSGAYDNDTIESAESLGLTAVQWSVDSIDWKNATPEKLRARVAQKVFPGAILLFHLGKENTLEALPGILDDLFAAGYGICPVGELLLRGETYVDPDGVQRRAEKTEP